MTNEVANIVAPDNCQIIKKQIVFNLRKEYYFIYLYYILLYNIVL